MLLMRVVPLHQSAPPQQDVMLIGCSDVRDIHDKLPLITWTGLGFYFLNCFTHMLASPWMARAILAGFAAFTCY